MHVRSQLYQECRLVPSNQLPGASKHVALVAIDIKFYEIYRPQAKLSDQAVKPTRDRSLRCHGLPQMLGMQRHASDQRPTREHICRRCAVIACTEKRLYWRDARRQARIELDIAHELPIGEQRRLECNDTARWTDGASQFQRNRSNVGSDVQNGLARLHALRNGRNGLG